jgi:DNA-binding transcriptional LysR family regulator
MVYIVTMRETNIKQLDLNLLVALHALLEERHVSRAAERVNLSQPAMSRALARLRVMFQDPLLVKGSSGMILTTRAKDLYQPLQNILREITHIVSPPSFDPATMQGEIVIATRDYELATILPKIIAKVTTAAPHLKLSIIQMIGDDLSLLEKQKADFVLAGTDSQSAALHRYVLLQEKFSCILSSTNPVLREGMNLETYLQMKHCLVTISSFGVSMADTILAQKKLKRNIVIRVPNFLAVPHIVAESDLIATLPHRLCELISEQKKVKIVDPPIKIPHFSIYLYWHIRNQENPIHKWFRKLVKESI